MVSERRPFRFPRSGLCLMQSASVRQQNGDKPPCGAGRLRTLTGSLSHRKCWSEAAGPREEEHRVDHRAPLDPGECTAPAGRIEQPTTSAHSASEMVILKAIHGAWPGHRVT